MQRPVTPVLHTDAGFPVQFADGGGGYLAAPKGLSHILCPAYRNTGQIHRNKRFGDKYHGMLEAVGKVFPEAKYQCRTVHFYRNVFSAVPKSNVKLLAKMLKAIHTQENKKAARVQTKAVVAELEAMRLIEAAKK